MEPTPCIGPARSGSPRCVVCCNEASRQRSQPRIPPLSAQEYPSVRPNTIQHGASEPWHALSLLTEPPLFSLGARLSSPRPPACQPATRRSRRSCISATRSRHWPALPTTLAGRKHTTTPRATSDTSNPQPSCQRPPKALGGGASGANTPPASRAVPSPTPLGPQLDAQH